MSNKGHLAVCCIWLMTGRSNREFSLDIMCKVGVMGCDNRAFCCECSRNKSVFVSRRALTAWQDRGRVKTLSHHFSFYNGRHTHVYARGFTLLQASMVRQRRQRRPTTNGDKLLLFFDTWFMCHAPAAMTRKIYAFLLISPVHWQTNFSNTK